MTKQANVFQNTRDAIGYYNTGKDYGTKAYKTGRVAHKGYQAVKKAGNVGQAVQRYAKPMAARKVKQGFNTAKNIWNTGRQAFQRGGGGFKTMRNLFNTGTQVAGKAQPFLPALRGAGWKGAAKAGGAYLMAADMGLDAANTLFTDPRTGKVNMNVLQNYSQHGDKNMNLAHNNIKNSGVMMGTAKNALYGAANPVRNIMAFNKGVIDNAGEWGKVGWNAMTGPNAGAATTQQEVNAGMEAMRQRNPQAYAKAMAAKQRSMQR